MRRFLRLFFALLLSQLVLGLLLLFVLMAVGASQQGVTMVEDHSLLHVELVGEIIEYPTLPVLPLRRKPLSQTAVLEALEAAATDTHVEAVLVDLHSPALGWGKANELHEALLRFRETGKRAIAFANAYDEIDLYVAAACDSIFLPPSGVVYVNGIGFGGYYVRAMLDKVDAHANVARIGEYKSATEMWQRSDMSAEDREQNEWLLEDVWNHFIETVVTSRGLDRRAFETALEQGMLVSQDAVDQHVVDGSLQRAEILARFTDADGGLRSVHVSDYHDLFDQKRKDSGPAIAMVHSRGLILEGPNAYDPYTGPILGAQSVVDDLEDAVRDDDVEAIVLRIDSGGGEITASDAIRSAVQRAREIKPVVVSMVDVAASGGYMMSYPATSIVATPTTITGSIGAYLLKLNLRGAYNKLGITRDFATRGSHPLLFSDYHDWTADEESLLARQQWADYDRWIAGIADHRDLTPREVDEIGRGRVWTGRQAEENGLVDALGDQSRAVEIARELAEVPESRSLRIVHYPRPRGILRALLENPDLLFASVLERGLRTQRLPPAARMSLISGEISR